MAAMEELLALVPGFVDILVLAGGRASSGAAATWRPGDVQKALRWALFFEEVPPRDLPLPRSLHRARFRFRLFLPLHAMALARRALRVTVFDVPHTQSQPVLATRRICVLNGVYEVP